MSESPVYTRQVNDPALRIAAVLRAIEAGNYGPLAKAVARDTNGLAPGRVRHALYAAGCESAGDALG